MLLLFNHKKLFLNASYLFLLKKLKGNNYKPYYLPLI